MKTIIFYLVMLLPVSCFTQCPKWIGGNVDSTLLLEKVTEKYLQVPLERSVEKGHKGNIDFTNNSCNCEFFYTTGKQKSREKGKKRVTAINSIVIIGPIDKVKKMYTEYFYPLIKPCDTAKHENSVTYAQSTISYFLFPVNGKNLAQINLHR